jgi:hypothetical protein
VDLAGHAMGEFAHQERQLLTLARIAAKHYRPTAEPVPDFELTDEEMARIAGLDTGRSLFFDHRDPTQAARLTAARLDI